MKETVPLTGEDYAAIFLVALPIVAITFGLLWDTAKAIWRGPHYPHEGDYVGDNIKVTVVRITPKEVYYRVGRKVKVMPLGRWRMFKEIHQLRRDNA